MITAGPARRMVTLLPRNKPTPMAPPIAIIVSCLWLKRRCRPSPACDELASTVVPVACWSVMGGGGSKHHQIDVLRPNLHHRLYVVRGVVHVEGDPQSVITIRSDDSLRRQLSHK